MAQTGARPLPLKNTTFCLPIEVRTAAGALVTSWTGAAAMYSADGANFASVTAAPTEIQTSGIGYLNLTAAEMNCDLIEIKVTVTNSGALVMSYAPPIFNDTSIRVNLVDVIGTALTEGAGGRLAAAIIKFFDKASPTGTINSLPDVVPGSSGGLPALDSNLSLLANVILRGTASAGGTNTITLTGGSTTDNLYKYAAVQIISGTGAGQSRLILDYVGSTKVATVNKNWTTAPDATSVFVLLPWQVPTVVHSGIAQAGAASTITLQSVASATDNIYNQHVITIFSGTGAFQSRLITGYIGSTKVATLDSAWATNPDSTSVYEISAVGPAWSDVFQWNGTAVATPDTAGVPVVNLKYVLGTLLTETVGGYIAAGIKKFFDVLNGTATLLNLPLNTDYTVARAAKLDNLDAAVSTRSTYAGADTPGTVTLLTRIPGVVQPQTGDSFARIGVPAGGSVSADIAEIEGETDAIQASTASLTFTVPNRVDASVPAASDPLAVPVPGAYASGTAGYDIGLLPSIQASTAQIGAANLTFPSPAFNIPTRPIVAGRAYNSTYGNALSFTITNLLIDLTGPGVTCSLNIHVNGSNVPLVATADSATAGHVNIAAATTATWGPPADQQALRYAAELVVYSGSVPIDVTHGFVYVAAGVNNS